MNKVSANVARHVPLAVAYLVYQQTQDVEPLLF